MSYTVSSPETGKERTAEEKFDLGRGWFVVHTRTGAEKKVKAELERLQQSELSSHIFQALVPEEDVVELRRGKKQLKKRKFFPGYVLVEMKMDEKSYQAVRAIAGVTRFLGEYPDPEQRLRGRPAALRAPEVEELLQRATPAEGAKPRPAVEFEPGEHVRITEGPFKHFVGVVEGVNEERAKLKLAVTIFGRPTPVELDFLQVEKV